MDRTALVSLGNQVVVIGLDGKLRVLTEGQQPLPGEVVVTSTDVGPLDLNVQLTQEQGSKDVTDDVLQIISAIEQGQDPSAVDEEFAPAAGENGGSSLQTSATIVRDGTELLASTSFETIGIESLGLSQTQVLALNDLFRSNLQTSADSTDKPLATTPVTLDAIEEDGGSITITTEELLSNVDDEDKDTLSVENLIIDKGNGTLVDNGDGTWTFTPQIDDDTEVSFTFDIIDDEDLVVSGSANLDILPINDAPNAENDVITTEEDTAVTIDVLVNDSDVEGDALSIQSASVPSEQGSVDIVDGKLVFTPAENFNGEATITYIVTDGDLTDEAKVTVTVTPVNDSPVAVDDTVSTQEDTVVTIDVLPNDSDVDGDKLSIQSASVPEAQGKVEIVDGKLVFTPAENFNGHAEITYTVTDGELTDEAKVTVTVNPVNDAPIIKVDAVESITEDAVNTDTVVATLTVRDTDTPEDQLTVSLENNSNGYFVLVGDEVKLTQAGVDAVNNDELNLKGLTISASVSDGVNPTASDSDSLIVNRVNDAPTIKVDAVESITEDAVSTDTVVATLTVRDTDTPEDQLTVSLENNSNGYFVLVGNEVKLTQAGVDAVNNDELNLKDLTISASVSDGVNPTANDSDSLIVNRVNDAPVAKDDIATTQEDTAVTIDVLPNDSDVDGDKLSIQSASVPEAQGKVEIVDGKLVFTPAENFHGDAEITYTLTDGALTDQATVNVTVNAVNDTPVVESNLADQTLAEDFTPYTIDLNTAFSDVDNVDGELTFSVSGNSNVLVSIENGIATISPTADWNGSETLTFTATDPSGESVSQTVNFTVAPVADIVADKATVVEDMPTIIKVLGNDMFEGDDKVVSLDTNNGPANGTVSVNPDGSVTYTPNDNYHGADSFTYIVTSGGVSESTTVNVDVTPVNDAPVAKDDIATTQEDTVVTIDVLPNDSDVDGDKLSIESASVPKEQGTVEVVDGKLVFTPAENFNGDAEITYTVTDGQLTDEAKVTVTVNPVDDAPTIKVDAVESITEDAVNTDTVVASLTVRDTDTPEDQLTVSLENNSNGYFVLVGNEVKLTQAGVDAVNNDELNLKDLTISASVSDGVNPTANDSDSLVVNRVNDAPTVENAIADQELSEDFATYTIDLNDAFKDSDSALNFSVSGNSNVLVSIENGIATITPTADWNGSETLTFTATDPSGESVSQTVNFTVAPVADIVADKATVVEDTPTIIKVLGNDTFEGTDKVVSLDTNNGPANGTVSVNPDGSVTYTPNDNYHGADSFTYIVTSGGVSESTTVNVDVTPVNDVPVAKDDTATTQEDTAVTIDVLPNDTDIDGDTLRIDSASVPSDQGTVEIVDGKLVFTPAENFNGNAEITYTVTDGQLTDEAKVTVTVNPVNDAPTIKVDAVESITEDAVSTDTVIATLEVADTDTPEDQLTVSLENNSNGYFVLVGNEVKLTQVGVDAVNNDELNLKDLTISASVSDGVNPTASDSDSLIVNRVNDAPTVENAIADQVLSEDFASYTIDLNDAFKDSDSALNFSVSGNSNVLVSIENGIATISPTADWNGSETLTFTATDPSGESVSQTVNFTVAPVADIVADKATVVEDTPTIIKVLGNDTFEGDGKVVSLDTNNGPANGTVSVNPDGSVTYTPNDNYVGKDTFTYVVTSGGVSESTAVEVNVTPVNDAPVAKDDIATTQEDTAVTIDVLPNDTDVDGDKLSIQSASVPEAQGKVEIVDGKLVFTPAENINGHAEIIYTVTDSELTDEAKVTVTVNPVNDAPTIKVDAVESITEDAVNTDTVVATLTVRDTDTPEDQLTVSLENNSNGYFVLVGNEVKLTQAGVDAVNNDELNLKDLTISASVSDGVNPTASDSDSLVVNRVNDAPTVENAIADQELSEDFATYTIDLNDAFKDSDSALNFSVSGNSNVLVSIENGIATISPTADWNGSETLTFTATDPSGESISQTVNFTVAPVADIVADKATVVEDTSTVIKVLGNDTFEGDGKVVSLDTNNGPANGTVSVNPDGSVTYTPNDNYHGTDSFTYIVTSGGVSESTTVSVDVTPVNDAPVAKDDIATTQEDTAVTIDVLPNDSDVDGDKLSIESASVPKEQGTVEVVNGKLVFTPAENFNGDAEITYTVTDGQLTDEAKVTVTVNPVNDAPTIKVDAVEGITENAVSTDTLVATLEVADTDTPEDQLTVSLENNSNGYFVLVGDEVKLTQAGVDAVNNDELNLKDLTISASVSDGVNPTANDSDSLIVNRVNDAPTIKVDAVESITEDAVSTDTVVATLTVRDTDTPEDQLTVSLENNSNGYFVLVGDEVKLTQAGVDAVNNDELNLKDLTISASVSDGVNPTANDSDSLVVNRVNDAPTVENAIADQVLSEDFDAYTIDLNEVFKDSDSSLEFSVSGNNSIQISIVNGVATITPTADWNGKETITFTAKDPSGESVNQTVDFTVAPVVDIEADSADVVEDTPTIINVLGNDTFEGADKVVSLGAENGPKNGTVIVNNDGTVTYTPDDNYVGEDTFTYIVTSGGVSESTTVSVDVTPENDAPVAKDDTAITDEDTPVTIDVLPNDTDVDGDKLSIESASVPKEQGTVEVVNGKLVFTPAENFNGDAEITYTVTDGALTDQATVKVTVNAVNDTPVVESNVADQTLAEDFTPYTIDLNTVFSDVDNVDGELKFSVSGNSNIQVAIVNGIATITPTADWNGSETLTFTATDPSGESVSQTVDFTVTPVADIVADKATVVEDTPTIIKVLGNDTFEGDGKVVSLDTNNGPANGTVSVNPDGSVTYTPNDNYVGKDTFTYVVTSGGVSESTAVEVNVTPVNDAPVAKDDIATTQEDTAVTIDVLSNDTDVDGDKLSIQSATVPEAQGKVEIVDGKLVFTPAENFNGHAEITYTVTDGALTDQATVKVTVNAVNDTPVVESNIADQALAEDFTPYTIDLNTAFSDVDNVDGELTFSVSGNSNIQVEIVNGVATITPTADWNGKETITFTAKDSSGESISQTVNFTVAPVADIVADKATVVEDTPTIIKVLGNDTFEDDGKVVSLDTNNGPANGTVSVNPDGSVTYTPNDNYVGKDTFTYVVTSGGVSESTTVTVNVTPVNDKPESEDFTHVVDDQLTHVVFDTDTKPLGSGDSKDHIADVEDDLKGNDLHVRITELPTSGTLFFKDSDGELHEIKEVSDTLYDKDSLYYEADNVGFLLGIKDRPNTPNGSESTSDFNNWGLSEDGGPSHSRTEHLANGASITISSDSGELAQYNRQVSHIGNGIADNDGQGIEKGETITIDLSNNPVGSVNLGLDGLGGLFDYGDDNAALITVTYLDSNNVQQTQTFEFLKPEGNFMLFQETSVGYGKDLALPEGSVITQLDFSTKNEGNWELRYVEGVPAEDSFGYVAVDSESGVSDPSTVNIVNEMLDGNVTENGPAVQSITGVTVVEGDDVTFSVSLNNATDQTVKYQVDFSAEGSSTSSQDIDLSNATFTSCVKYLGGYLIVPAGVNGFEITIPSIDDQLVESTESLVIKVGDVSGVGYIDDNDVPPTVQSNEISGLEDEAIVITLEHLGVVDSGVNVEFDTSALNGSLQVKGPDGWEVVSGSVLASDIESGLVRYVPAEHESGADVFDKDGVGNGLDTYEQIHFTVSDGNSSASGTLSIDIEPVADPVKIDLTFGPVTSVPVTLGGSWSTDEELKDLLEASNLPGLDFEHVVTQAFNNGHAGNDLMLSGDTESPLSFVGDQQAGANVDAQGSDIFVTGGGNDSIYGGIGSLDDQAETDTVVYSGKLSDYDFSYYPASDHSEVPYWIVEDSRFIDTKDVVSSTHKESGDHLYEIEQLIFQDAIIKLDNNTGEYVVLTEQQVSFELNLDLIDVDGSESFINDSVTFTGIPSGLTLEVNGKTVTENSDGSYTVDLSSEPNQTSHQLSGTITVPADYNGSLDFDVTATAGSVEVNNNTQMGADTASVSVRDYEFVSGTHGDNNIVGSDDNDVIVGDVQGLQIVEGQDYNIAFMLDTSGSMGYDVGRAVTELKTVLNTLIESASGPHSGKVNVLLTTFSTESKQVLELDLSSDNAKSQVESILDAIVKLGDGNTNYEAGFQSALNWFENADSGATNLSYFISDGRPNQATDNNVNWYSSKESVVLGVSEQQLVTLADVLPSDYRFGDTVTYNNKTVIDFRGTVYSLSTGEEMGRMLNSYEYDDFGNNVLEQANNAYSALAEFSEVRSIGIGGHLNEDSLKHFDSDGVVRTNIDVNQLAEVILGKEVSLMQGKDEISSLDGNDIIFGDAIRFDINGEQGVSALQNYVASQLGKDVALVTKEEVHHYITENQAEFEQSRYYDQADTIYGGAGNDILFGQGGNDKLFGGADNDILIGGLGSDILTGGDGEDIFKWIDVANERDTVTDFSSSEDSLDFSDLFDDLSKDEVGDLLSDLQSGSHTGDAGGYHVEVSQDGSADTNLSITKGSSTLDIHFNSASVDDITQHLIASLDSQYKDM
ncbi:tandem-95 repeat protein [Vibrio parahaemolyticus]|nr:tandem-95 repeat protein [Vibrio parahaemolyticus]EGR2883851.1 tandem-95 repeat protein [Vibrio parahaemolyticus]EGR2975018.1 tandem-95 repeat protein [Vibrio parahaemolyticus]EGR3010263.1 tandem-95 repeat protein [Vibrio parahaemolyticus]EJC6741386.1 tandem-95 repeat protein [Vibrio parahaemolyticus]